MLGTVWFGYISFLLKNTTHAVSLREYYEDMAYVRLRLD